MTAPIDPAELADARDGAAYWFARVQSGALRDDERAAFEAWRADPANLRQYQAVERLWDAAGAVPPERLRSLGYASSRMHGAPASATRRRLAWGLGTACAAGAVAAVAGARGWTRPPLYELAASTARGERRRIDLPDGSTAELNTATALRVRYYADRRQVELADGECLFSVSHDGRPFSVDAQVGSVHVTGTQFNVLRSDARLDVTVAEGSVRVEAGPWWHRRTALLSAGWNASLQADGELATRTHVDLAERLAWRDGQVVFRDTRLAAAVDELNRYLPEPVLLADPRAATLRISGIFRTDQPRELLAALPRIVPVRLVSLADGRTEIRAAQAGQVD